MTPALAPANEVRRDRRRSLAAAGIAAGGHALILGLLIAGWQPAPPAAPKVRTLAAQMIEIRQPALPDAVPVAIPDAPAEAPAPPLPAPLAASAPVELPPPAPVEIAPPPSPDPITATEPEKPAPVDQAALAEKRVEQEKREQQRREQERQRRAAEERAREHAREQADARAATEAATRAAAEAAAAAEAERARAAEREAASRPYLPIEKEAPDYPPRALERRIEGDCTVVYRVNTEGRVEDPRALDDCHPLFVNPSLAAARRFRYQPRTVAGRAVAVDNVRNTFHFKIR